MVNLIVCPLVDGVELSDGAEEHRLPFISRHTALTVGAHLHVDLLPDAGNH